MENKFNSKTIIDIIQKLKISYTIPIFQPRSGKTYNQKLLTDRERLLFELLAVQSEIERLDKEK